MSDMVTLAPAPAWWVAVERWGGWFLLLLFGGILVCDQAITAPARCALITIVVPS